ncbi:Fic/DOC family N-terminal domain-containing protein [Leptospira bouyouniensis]|uniref:Fic/DOC family N-terminal domain-containing protein n=1 Tax=Leptospira bouyouniensis TaxID=2484911 RepID=UPI003CC60197
MQETTECKRFPVPNLSQEPKSNVTNTKVLNHRKSQLNVFSQLSPNVDFFIKLQIQKERTKSSNFEGTQSYFDEAVQKQELISHE